MPKIKQKKVIRPASGMIKASVAEMPDSDESKLYTIGFKYFNDRLCVLKSVDAKVARKVHEIYRRIGSCDSALAIRGLPYDIKSILNSGHYSKYYKNITDDVEINEFDVDRCRGFFFYDNANKIIQMLAIDHHPENKKSKK